MVGQNVAFAYIRPGDDFHHEGERYCKLNGSTGESLKTGITKQFRPEETVRHATGLSLYRREDLDIVVDLPA